MLSQALTLFLLYNQVLTKIIVLSSDNFNLILLLINIPVFLGDVFLELFNSTILLTILNGEISNGPVELISGQAEFPNQLSILFALFIKLF